MIYDNWFIISNSTGFFDPEFIYIIFTGHGPPGADDISGYRQKKNCPSDSSFGSVILLTLCDPDKPSVNTLFYLPYGLHI